MLPQDDLSQLRGVGEEAIKKLNILGIETVRDLIHFWPTRYEDYSKIEPIAQIRTGHVTLLAHVLSVKGRYIRRGMHITEAIIEDDSGAVKVVWFNQPYREKYFKSGQEYYFSGEYGFGMNSYQLQNPSVEAVSSFTKNTARIIPIYHQTKGFDSRKFRLLTAQILQIIESLSEYLPDDILEKYDLEPIAEATKQMHWPDDSLSLERAKRRIAFDELFVHIFANTELKSWNDKQISTPIKYSDNLAHEFVDSLPFKLTDDQKIASWEIIQDIGKKTPMNRLLEGDVGSGKTVVSAMNMYLASKSKVQSALLAPTSILASQHASTLDKTLSPLGVKLSLLTADVKAKARTVLLNELKQGKIDVLVGTHAILQKDVEFKNLGFIVIDEQHRFGVKQRQELLERSKKFPHLLSMTATPIPRSLALTVYGELDISIISQKPGGRKPVKTKVMPAESRDELYSKIKQQISEGRQAFIVCPLIDENEQFSESESVINYMKLLKKSVLKDFRIAMLHGKMKPLEKDAVMQSFANAEIDILVSTTVVEVGIDVPNANIMAIESAERFGLAQLHQLRGRVGRGEHQSYCYLVQTNPKTSKKRLKAMESTSDGFKLAELDLEMRGPGAVYGLRQHGALELTIANISDTKLIKQVKQVVDLYFDGTYSLADHEVKQKIKRAQRLMNLN